MGSLLGGQVRYPKPGPIGGALVREVIGFLRKETSLGLPLGSHILIGYSAGVDSTALAHLLIKYGRRIVPSEKIRLVHIHHGWRGEESDRDAEHAVRQARNWGVPIEVIRLANSPSSSNPEGRSWEDLARDQRKEVFKKLLAKGPGRLLLTAHHADDLAETLLWRLFTGQARTHGAGILPVTDTQLRPLLSIRKERLRRFLEEERVEWREDRTNHEGRFLRSRMRAELMPAVEQLFPQAVSHLVTAALHAHESSQESEETAAGGIPTEAILFSAAGLSGLKMRRSHWQSLAKLESGTSFKNKGAASLSLPEGWTLSHEREKRNQYGYGKGVKKTPAKSAMEHGERGERWVLEKKVTSGKTAKKPRKAAGR